jgi:SAM-dependent methyltransferase
VSDRRSEAIAHIERYIERARRFSGWNFDDLDVTSLPPGEPPWEYAALAREHAATTDSVVDFGTGGGEIFSRIIAGYGGRAVASEEWVVNAPVARDRLRPLGVHVVWADSLRPPFAAASFGLALSRHEAIEPAEIDRVLRPGGVFITQQVGRRNWLELDDFIKPRTDFPHHELIYQEAFRAAGYEVEAREHEWPLAYRTIGEVAFMLMISPWEFPEFDPIREVDSLLALEDACGTEDGIVLTAHRYLIMARKPA